MNGLRWTEEELMKFNERWKDSGVQARIREIPNELPGRAGGVVRVQTDKPSAASTEKPAKKSKYRNVKTTVDGQTFDSKLEAGRYGKLVLMQKAGEISNLTCQVTFRLEVNGVLICKYIADFTYNENDGSFVVEDAKGVRTPKFIVQKNLMRAIHGIEVKEFCRPARRRTVRPK